MALCKSNVGVQFVFGYLIVFMDLSISHSVPVTVNSWSNWTLRVFMVTNAVEPVTQSPNIADCPEVSSLWVMGHISVSYEV